jgi:succinoglycan biosynthesis transport protein ExoP
MTEAAQLPSPGEPSRALQEAHQTRLPQPYGQGMPSAEQTVDDDAIDLREYWHILLRYKWTVALVVALSMGIALVATFNTTPIYKASTLVQIDRTSNRIVEYGDVTAEGSAGMRDPEFYTTQYELLKSRSLARRVIDQIGLRAIDNASEPEDPSFLDGIKQSLKGMIATLSSTDNNVEDNLPPADREQARRKSEENLLLESLSIEPVRNSRLVRVGYESPYPGEAAAVANAIANNFINLNLERRYDASSYAKQFLQEQLAQARATLEESEKRFVAYARERQIVNFEDRLEILRNQLREMNTNLVEAESARFAAESEYQELLEASAGGAPGLQESELIQTLKQRRSDLQADYQQQLEIFKPGYPAMQKLQRQIAEIDAEIERETASIRESVRATFEARIREEAKLRQRIQEAKDEALLLQDRTTDYETLRREVETNRELYDGLLQRMKEVGVAAGVGENNISVVDAATVPLRPYKPSLRKNLAIALVLGLFLGAGLAFLLNSLDDTIKSADDVERRVGAPVLSLVPHASARDSGLTDEELPMIVFRDPKSAVAEAVRSLRTSLLFSTADGAPRTMHFTSSSPSEGKTTTAVSTAIAFAQAGDKVLLIDCDLRNPSLHRAFGLPNSTGLTNHLAGNAKPAEIAQPTQVMRLFTITSGPLPPNPVELLSTAKMVDLLSHSAERFDRVIIDGPPVIGLADALLLANLAKATIFVVEPGSTRIRDLDGSIRRLHQASARIMGAVLTKIGRSGQGYGYGYGYGYSYNYLYSYGGKGDHTAALPQQEPA